MQCLSISVQAYLVRARGVASTFCATMMLFMTQPLPDTQHRRSSPSMWHTANTDSIIEPSVIVPARCWHQIMMSLWGGHPTLLIHESLTNLSNVCSNTGTSHLSSQLGHLDSNTKSPEWMTQQSQTPTAINWIHLIWILLSQLRLAVTPPLQLQAHKTEFPERAKCCRHLQTTTGSAQVIRQCGNHMYKQGSQLHMFTEGWSSHWGSPHETWPWTQSRTQPCVH